MFWVNVEMSLLGAANKLIVLIQSPTGMNNIEQHWKLNTVCFSPGNPNVSTFETGEKVWQTKRLSDCLSERVTNG